MIEIDNIIWNLDKKYIDIINQYFKILLIIGPSGSGKSTIANYIESKFNYKMINLYTTRKLRGDFLDKNTISISKEEFLSKISKKEFFLSRTGLEPFYGYTKYDFDSIINENKIPIFMFRNHGIKLMSKFIKNMDVIFITGNAKDIANRSQSIAPHFSECDIQKVLDENRHMIDKLLIRGINIQIIQNTFDNNFFDSICKLKWRT